MRDPTPKRGDAVEALMISALALTTLVQAAAVAAMIFGLFR